MQAIRTEAHQLAEAAGEEEELWRLHVADLFWPFWLGSITPEAEAEGRRIGPEAAAYFEARGEWEAVSEALDGYSGLLLTVGAYADMIEVAQRRLAIRGLSLFERGDACATLTQARCEIGDYRDSVASALRIVDVLGAGISPILLANTSGFGVLAACLGGLWSELNEIAAMLEEAWQSMGRDPGARYLARGFLAMLHVATARDDRAAADRAAAALGRLAQGVDGPLLQSLTSAYHNDDARSLDESLLLDTTARGSALHSTALAIMFLSERGEASTPHVFARVTERSDGTFIAPLRRAVSVAAALASGDNARLAAAVDDAEARGLIPHAARMRIVLAQRTGDRALLERARPVLERLGDRQFLRRLEEVAATLH
jgi:hypothetical protein